MNTCGTCTHWEHPYDGYRNPVLLHIDPYDAGRSAAADTMVNRGDRWGHCNGVSEIPEIVVTPETDLATIEVPLAVTKDGSDYMAELLTQAEFGCVLWEAKP